ncbi:MAG: PBP1A family penicillin-binding protein [Endomicrobiaceae bacterium]|nr:PBP1A family penicillin-binding protein [Endomicrobiaceae bacterium]
MLKHKIKTIRHHIDKNIKPHTKKGLSFVKSNKKEILISLIAIFFTFSGIIALWISTFQMPDLESFDTRKITQSTKIYDRTGTILLYDIHENTKRVVVPFENISKDIKNATVAIEDNTFYEHGGIKISSFFRAVIANLFSGSFSQGGSTITQQVIKNSLLTTEKKISRKLKEWFLSIQLEKTMTKDEILAIYLNGNPYGGTVYGVEEACETFFGKKAIDVTLAEAAYIAAIPKAPTYYSPYGQNKTKLDDRQKLVLAKMLEYKFISQKEYDSAIQEKVTFLPQQKYGIKAPHFVEFIKQYLVDKYGEDAIKEKGFKVITTLNYDLQEKAEEIVKRRALENTENFNASNAAVVVIDPKTGQILSMVGSRDYFDKEIDGNFNVTLAYRQPGSTFKPFVYATAFEKGYTPDTVVFDTPTEFQTTCNPDGTPINPNTVISSSTACYMPEDYDGEYLGPISLRNALAQSRNVPAVKMLYLTGIKDSIETAKSMGVKNLTNPNQYGLTLVIGGGEVSLLDMTSAYGVFANDGIRNPYTGILSIEDLNGNVLESYTQKSQTVLSPSVAENISDVLSDVTAKIPAYGANSPLFFSGKQVASKTGTTNNYKDVWTIGYTPEIVVGAWAGNNDNTPMVKKVAGTILAPLWHEVMEAALASTTGELFIKPPQVSSDLKPILRGFWQGNETYFIDTISGKLATDMTPEETKKEVSIQNIHSILYYVDKNNPLGPVPTNPENDSQFISWEYSVQNWLSLHPQTTTIKPTMYDDIHTEANKPIITILSPTQSFEYGKDSRINIIFSTNSKYSIIKADFYLNDEFVGTSFTYPFVFNFIPSSTDSFEIGENQLKIVVYDGVYNRNEITIPIKIKN